MKKSVIKNENQVILFNLIEKTLHSNISLVDDISDLLNIGPDAAYRRRRGAKPISLEEAIKLSKHYQISLDLFTDVNDKQLHFKLAPENVEDANNYLKYALEWSNNLASFQGTPECEIIMSATDVPAFNFLSFKELGCFQLYAWNKGVYDLPESYEAFVKELNTDELSKCYRKITNHYQQIPSSEIWTDHTIDSLLDLMQYHSDMKHFSDKNTPLFLCEQLLELMDTLYDWAKKGTKGSNAAPYKMYVSEIDLGNTFIILKNAKMSTCLLKLFGSNGLSITDESFCHVIENWLNLLAGRATLISGTSEKERFKFFNIQRQKIIFLMEKIQQQ